MADVTAADLIAGITNALRAEDVDAVGDLLRALMAVDPQEALAVYDTLQLGITFAKEGLL